MRLARYLCIALLLPAISRAAPGDAGSLEDAAAMLSRYPAGTVPLEPGVVELLRRFGAEGSPDHISLLRNVAEQERTEIASAAAEAMEQIRERQHDAQREVFARGLPNWPELASASTRYVDRGLGREEAICVAYSAMLLAPEEAPIPVRPEEGDAEKLLAAGRPRHALAAALLVEDEEKRGWLEARALEDLGQVRAAVRTYAMLAASGSEEAKAALDGYGVDVERLLLGMLASPNVSHEVNTAPSTVLEVLVRHGQDLTVTVLAERMRGSTISDRERAAEALARMLDGSIRDTPLAEPVEHDARRALALVSQEERESSRVGDSEASKEREAEP